MARARAIGGAVSDLLYLIRNARKVTEVFRLGVRVGDRRARLACTCRSVGTD